MINDVKVLEVFSLLMLSSNLLYVSNNGFDVIAVLTLLGGMIMYGFSAVVDAIKSN